MNRQQIEMTPIGTVRSSLTDVATAPKQGDEGAPDAWLRVHPRNDPSRPQQGVFGTRSPDRPNPIGLHRVQIASIEEDGAQLRVRNLEAVDGTPILDVKPVLSEEIGER